MDIDQRIDTLGQRLSAVERKSRAWRILALLLLVALIGGVASEGVFDNASWAADEKGAKEKVTKFDVVEAKTLRIRAPNGAITCEITTLGNAIAQFTLRDPSEKDGQEAARINMHVVTPNSGNSDAFLGVIGGENSNNTRIVASDQSGYVEMKGSRIRFQPQAVAEEKHELERKLIKLRGKLEGADLARWMELQARGFSSEMGIGQTGGYIILNNQFLKPVVDIQSNKTNQGAIYLGDVNGNTVNGLFVK